MESKEVNKTQIGKLKRKFVFGTIWSLLCVASLYVCIDSLFNAHAVEYDMGVMGAMGIGFLLLFSVGAGFCAWTDLSGRCPVKCPCCGKQITIKPSAKTKKCEYCKNINTRNGDTLEASTKE